MELQLLTNLMWVYLLGLLRRLILVGGFICIIFPCKRKENMWIFNVYAIYHVVYAISVYRSADILVLLVVGKLEARKDQIVRC